MYSEMPLTRGGERARVVIAALPPDFEADRYDTVRRSRLEVGPLFPDANGILDVVCYDADVMHLMALRSMTSRSRD